MTSGEIEVRLEPSLRSPSVAGSAILALALGLASAVAVAEGSIPFDILLAPIGGAAVAGCGAILATLRAVLRPRVLRVLADRAILIDPAGEHEVADGSVEMIAIRETSWGRGWLQGPRLVRVGVRLEDGRRFSMARRYWDGEHDPVARWARRIHEAVAERHRRALAAGRSIHGEGWVLQPRCLVDGSGQAYPLGRLEASLERSGVVVRESGRPVLEIPTHAFGAWLLLDLLAPDRPGAMRAVRLGRPSQPVLALAVGLLGAGMTALAWLSLDQGWKTEFDPRAMLPIGVLLLVAGGGTLARGVAARGILRFDDRGFAAGERHVGYEEVESVACERKEDHAEGRLRWVAWRIRLRLRSGETIDLRHAERAPSGFAEWIERVVSAIERRSLAEIEAGKTIHGGGWSLDRESLEVDKTIPVVEISGVDATPAALRVWRANAPLPAATIPLDRENAIPLSRVLERLVTARPARTEAVDGSAAEGLGRVLFEVRAPRRTIAWIIGFAVFLQLGTLSFLSLPRRDGGHLMAAGPAALGVALVAWAIYLRRCALVVHEAGVARRTPLGERSLRYEDVAGFSIETVSSYVEGAYVRTSHRIVLRPRTEVSPKPLRHSISLTRPDPGLERLREHVTEMLASRMAAERARGLPVSWTPHLRFLPEGLEVRTWSGVTVHPYAAIEAADVQEGRFRLRAGGGWLPTLTEKTSVENFWPGFLLLQRILAELSAGSTRG